jgi:hypothetical protein
LATSVDKLLDKQSLSTDKETKFLKSGLSNEVKEKFEKPVDKRNLSRSRKRKVKSIQIFTNIYPEF